MWEKEKMMDLQELFDNIFFIFYNYYYKLINNICKNILKK